MRCRPAVTCPNPRAELPVSRPFRQRLRRQSVDGVPVGPTGIEHERRALQVMNRVDPETRSVDQPAARTSRTIDRQLRTPSSRTRGNRSLPKHVEEPATINASGIASNARLVQTETPQPRRSRSRASNSPSGTSVTARHSLTTTTPLPKREMRAASRRRAHPRCKAHPAPRSAAGGTVDRRAADLGGGVDDVSSADIPLGRVHDPRRGRWFTAH